jgi:hypothetical protein
LAWVITSARAPYVSKGIMIRPVGAAPHIGEI